jgi:hypothetical protein
VRVGGYHDDWRFRVLACKPGEGRVAQCAGHVQIQQQQVEVSVQLVYLLLQLCHVSGFMQLRTGIQLANHLLQRTAKQRVIVSYQDTQPFWIHLHQPFVVIRLLSRLGGICVKEKNRARGPVENTVLDGRKGIGQ